MHFRLALLASSLLLLMLTIPAFAANPTAIKTHTNEPQNKEASHISHTYIQQTCKLITEGIDAFRVDDHQIAKKKFATADELITKLTNPTIPRSLETCIGLRLYYASGIAYYEGERVTALAYLKASLRYAEFPNSQKHLNELSDNAFTDVNALITSLKDESEALVLGIQKKETVAIKYEIPKAPNIEIPLDILDETVKKQIEKSANHNTLVTNTLKTIKDANKRIEKLEQEAKNAKNKEAQEKKKEKVEEQAENSPTDPITSLLEKSKNWHIAAIDKNYRKDPTVKSDPFVTSVGISEKQKNTAGLTDGLAEYAIHMFNGESARYLTFTRYSSEFLGKWSANGDYTHDANFRGKQSPPEGRIVTQTYLGTHRLVVPHGYEPDPNNFRFESQPMPKIRILQNKEGDFFAELYGENISKEKKIAFSYDIRKTIDPDFSSYPSYDTDNIYDDKLDAALKEVLAPGMNDIDKAHQILFFYHKYGKYNKKDDQVAAFINDTNYVAKHHNITRLLLSDKSLAKHLQGKGVDCDVWAEHFIRTARRHGINARLVSGMLEAKKDGRIKTDHAWAEVWDPIQNIWILMDPTPPKAGTPRSLSLMAEAVEERKRMAILQAELLAKHKERSDPPDEETLAMFTRKRILSDRIKYLNQIDKDIEQVKKLDEAVENKNLNSKINPHLKSYKTQAISKLRGAYHEIQNLKVSPLEKAERLEDLMIRVQAIAEKAGSDDEEGSLNKLLRSISSHLLKPDYKIGLESVVAENEYFQIQKVDDFLYFKKLGDIRYTLIPGLGKILPSAQVFLTSLGQDEVALMISDSREKDDIKIVRVPSGSSFNLPIKKAKLIEYPITNEKNVSEGSPLSSHTLQILKNPDGTLHTLYQGIYTTLNYWVNDKEWKDPNGKDFYRNTTYHINGEGITYLQNSDNIGIGGTQLTPRTKNYLLHKGHLFSVSKDGILYLDSKKIDNSVYDIFYTKDDHIVVTYESGSHKVFDFDETGLIPVVKKEATKKAPFFSGYVSDNRVIKVNVKSGEEYSHWASIDLNNKYNLFPFLDSPDNWTPIKATPNSWHITKREDTRGNGRTPLYFPHGIRIPKGEWSKEIKAETKNFGEVHLNNGAVIHFDAILNTEAFDEDPKRLIVGLKDNEILTIKNNQIIKREPYFPNLTYSFENGFTFEGGYNHVTRKNGFLLEAEHEKGPLKENGTDLGKNGGFYKFFDRSNTAFTAAESVYLLVSSGNILKNELNGIFLQGKPSQAQVDFFIRNWDAYRMTDSPEVLILDNDSTKQMLRKNFDKLMSSKLPLVQKLQALELVFPPEDPKITKPTQSLSSSEVKLLNDAVNREPDGKEVVRSYLKSIPRSKSMPYNTLYNDLKIIFFANEILP